MKVKLCFRLLLDEKLFKCLNLSVVGFDTGRPFMLYYLCLIIENQILEKHDDIFVDKNNVLLRWIPYGLT